MDYNASIPHTEADRVSSLELFFDLVFVFTITQLTSVLVHEPSWKGLLQVGLMLGLIFWMYGGYAWLTNAVVPDRIVRRLVLLGGMAGFLVMALAVPDAFHGSGFTFGLAYVLVVSIHLTMFARSTELTVSEAVIGLGPYNISTALMVLIGGALGGTAMYILWALAFIIEWISPKLIDPTGFEIQPSHFVERHGLVLIVAIGESVVAVGIGAAGLAVDGSLVVTAVLGLALSAGLWWSYFGFDEQAIEQSVINAEGNRRFDVAINAFGYAYELLLLGVIAVAAGMKVAIGHAFDPLPEANAIMLGAGAAVYLVGQALHRGVLKIGFEEVRLVAALLAAATIPLGTEATAFWQLAALVAIFVAMIVYETRATAARA
jgi:low temperature requirement protein LtrA